jgi:hypothetical protein
VSSIAQTEIPKPKSWDEFEDLVWDCYARRQRLVPRDQPFRVFRPFREFRGPNAIIIHTAGRLLGFW